VSDLVDGLRSGEIALKHEPKLADERTKLFLGATGSIIWSEIRFETWVEQLERWLKSVSLEKVFSFLGVNRSKRNKQRRTLPALEALEAYGVHGSLGRAFKAGALAQSIDAVRIVKISEIELEFLTDAEAMLNQFKARVKKRELTPEFKALVQAQLDEFVRKLADLVIERTGRETDVL
jgi:hypothetical protein